MGRLESRWGVASDGVSELDMVPSSRSGSVRASIRTGEGREARDEGGRKGMVGESVRTVERIERAPLRRQQVADMR